MALLLHVTIAIFSLAYSVYLFFAPSKAKLRISYVLIGLTLATGTYLIATSTGHMLEVCTTGLLYVGLSTLGIVSARRRIAVRSSVDR